MEYDRAALVHSVIARHVNGLRRAHDVAALDYAAALDVHPVHLHTHLTRVHPYKHAVSASVFSQAGDP